jgi:DNA polymerase III subunit epsilon
VNGYDSARVARRTWSQFARKGYGLVNVCDSLGYQFTPHDALEDAKAAGNILIAAVAKTNLTLDEWLVRVRKPIVLGEGSSGEAVRRAGNPEGQLAGEVLVFTGALSIPRKDAADMAAEVGCQVDPGVTKATTLLVVGDQDVRKLAGREVSSKQRKAEELIKKGQSIRILRESDFRQLVVLARGT